MLTLAPVVARKALEDDEVAGYRIPKGATVVANNWHAPPPCLRAFASLNIVCRRAITRDPERYPDPYTFRPERFLPLFDATTSPAEKEGILDPRTYAFGYGRRCAPLPLPI